MTTLDSPTKIPSVRNEMVQTAIKFLENPNVINTPLAQKQKFLQRKGLTDREIQVACEKSGAYTKHEEQSPLPPPRPSISGTINNYQPHQFHLNLFDRLRELVHNVAIFSIVAYVIHKFYERYISPFLFGKKKKTIEESIKDLDKSMKTSVDQLKDDLQTVKVEVHKINNQGSENTTNQQLTDLKLEVASVKGLLLSRKQFPSVANTPVVPPSIPAWQMSSVSPDNPDENDRDAEERKDLLEEVASGSGSSEPEHGMKTSESSLEIICSSRDCDSESCHSRKSNRDDTDKD